MKSKILKDTIFLNTSSIIAQILGMLQAVIIMRLLDPASYGIWLGLMVYLTYCNFANMGIENGIGLRLPYHQGTGNKERALQIQDTGYFAWSIISAFIFICLLGYSFLITHESTIMRLGLAIIGCMALSEQQISFYSRWQSNSLKDFKLVSFIIVLRSLISFLILIPLAYFFNISGFMIGALIVSVSSMIIWRIKSSYQFQNKLSLSAFRELINVGFPILLVVAGGVLISTLDRILILKFLGTVFLGYYGVVSLGGSALYGLLAQAGSSMGPHIAEDIGKNDNYAPSLEKYLVKPTIVFAYAVTILTSLLIIILPPFIEIVLKNYMPGLTAFYIYVPSFFFLSIILTANNILSNILITKGKQRYSIYIQAISIMLQLLFGIIFISFGWSIAGVALASLLATAFYGLIILFLASKYVLIQNRKICALFFDVLSPFFYAVPLISLIEWLGHQLVPLSPFLRGFVMLIMWSLVMIPMIYMLNKRVKIFMELKPIFSALRLKLFVHSPQKNV